MVARFVQDELVGYAGELGPEHAQAIKVFVSNNKKGPYVLKT
ncbi:hypothetical protein [Maridesulfovibrio bastinii]|nr:hypothetical protein [Maridesulfovibrio bastinii]